MTYTYHGDPFPDADIVDAPRPRLGAILNKRVLAYLVIVAALASATVGLGEYLVVRPIDDRRLDVSSRADELARKNEADEATLVGYEQFLATKADTDARYADATAAIPTQAELASVLGSVRDLATAARMHLVQFTPASSPTDDARDGLRRFNATALVRGRYADLRAFFESVAEFRRLLTVDSFTASQSPAQDGSLDATISLTCYYKALPPPPHPTHGREAGE